MASRAFTIIAAISLLACVATAALGLISLHTFVECGLWIRTDPNTAVSTDVRISQGMLIACQGHFHDAHEILEKSTIGWNHGPNYTPGLPYPEAYAAPVISSHHFGNFWYSHQTFLGKPDILREYHAIAFPAWAPIAATAVFPAIWT